MNQSQKLFPDDIVCLEACRPVNLLNSNLKDHRINISVFISYRMIIQIPTVKNANVAQKHLKAPFSQNCVFFSFLFLQLNVRASLCRMMSVQSFTHDGCFSHSSLKVGF